jgi:hypothetical protein
MINESGINRREVSEINMTRELEHSHWRRGQNESHRMAHRWGSRRLGRE